jgi:hypothetical protein
MLRPDAMRHVGQCQEPFLNRVRQKVFIGVMLRQVVRFVAVWRMCYLPAGGF